MNAYHVGIAAEAFAAGAFAHASCEVLVQYGANQPLFDLVAVRGGGSLRVSVKGSQDGGWGLIHSYKKGRDYHQAADEWARHQSRDVVFCLAQFQGVQLGESPRLYLASVSDIVDRHKQSRNGIGSTILYENWTYSRGVARGASDAIPDNWRFSEARLTEFLPTHG